MKTFQKIALVSAIAAAPFTSQAMEALDDSVLAATTGQAGVTIEIELGNAGITIDSVTYTDTQTGVDTDGGQVVLENISITGLGKLTQTIDVSGTGDLLMTTTAPTADVVIALGNDAADTTGAFSALALEATDGSQSEVINNLNMTVALGASTTTIKNLGNAASAGLGPLSGANVQDTATTAYSGMTSSMAIQMSSSLEIKDLDMGIFGYTNAQANILGQGHSTTVTAKGVLETAPVGAITYDASGVATSDNVADAAAVGLYNGTLSAVKDQIATGSAIQVSDVTVTGIGGGAMTMDQTIWAVGGDASVPGSTAGVYIQMGAMNADINVGGIAIGGHSIGSVEISGLRMAGLTQRIYGH